jgi:hypothetical protein
MGIGDKKSEQKKRDIKSASQYGWGFRFLLKAVYTEKEKGKKARKKEKERISLHAPRHRKPNKARSALSRERIGGTEHFVL